MPTSAKQSLAPDRPTDLTDEMADRICERLADGESLREICRDQDMPQRARVFRWLADPAHKAFADQYARAREASADADADDIGYYARQAGAGGIEAAQARAAIDGLKWSAAKRQPKKYGDRQLLEHTGADGGPIQYARMTPEERRARIEELERRRADRSGGA